MKELIQTKILSRPLIGVKTKDIVWTIGLIIAAVAAPAIFAHTPHNQWVTGTLVNAALFFAAYKLLPANALLVAIFPSTVALTRGLLPLPMAMMIPFIIISNILLINAFYFFKKKPLTAVIASSLAKFSFLYIIVLFFAEKINSQLIIMLQWPQLFTALAGGLLFLGLTKTFGKS